MNRILFQRIFAALLVLSFVVVLPMQGIAAAVSPVASSVPWAGNTETQTPDGCDWCATNPAMSMLCPAIFCAGLTGVLLEVPKFERPLPTAHIWSMPTARVGQSVTPDPDPPRSSI